MIRLSRMEVAVDMNENEIIASNCKYISQILYTQVLA
jgi:hypothetical protein